MSTMTILNRGLRIQLLVILTIMGNTARRLCLKAPEVIAAIQVVTTKMIATGFALTLGTKIHMMVR